MADLASLVRTHRAFVRGALLRRGLPERDVADATQDVFLVAHRRWDAYDDARSFRAWLVGICERVASVHRRRARRRPEVLDAELDIVETTTPERRAMIAEARAIARRALDSVPDSRRSVLVASDWEERPVPEIAAELGIPLNTAYSRLRLARADFARALEAA